MNIGQLLELAMHKLTAGSAARREAEILLCHALEVKRSFLYANPGMGVPRQRQACFQRLLRRRVQGMPIAYLTGIHGFWSLDLRVTPAVLIPRPETELLVEKALELIPAGARQRLADLGTGCGAIALALARERPHCEIHATDCSLDALHVAGDNARRHQLEQVQFHHGSWTNPLSGRFDLIVSNPPYIAQTDPHLQQGDCRFEPRLALSPGADGLSALRQIAAEVHELLVEGGWLLLEHGYDQAAAVRSILEAAAYSDIATYRDLAGIERICVGRSRPSLASAAPVHPCTLAAGGLCERFRKWNLTPE